MNREIAELWVTALRSGQYPQSNSFLRTTEGYCCLGVLCEIAVQRNIIPPASRSASNDIVYTYYGEDKFLPELVRMWADLPDVDPEVHREGYMDTLASMNDSGCDFEEIANVIEENRLAVEEVAAGE